MSEVSGNDTILETLSHQFAFTLLTDFSPTPVTDFQARKVKHWVPKYHILCKAWKYYI